MCMHFFPAHSEKQSEPFYTVLSRPVIKQPYCTAQNHVGMGSRSKTKVSCAVPRKCFSVSRCFTQHPSKTSPSRPGHHPAQHVVAPYTIPLPDFSAALWTALCPATCAALRTRTLSNFTTALVDSTQHSTQHSILHSTLRSTLQSTLHNTFAKFCRHALDNTLHSTVRCFPHRTFWITSCTAPCRAPLPDFTTAQQVAGERQSFVQIKSNMAHLGLIWRQF